MIPRNPHFSKLHQGYLFPLIQQRSQELLKKDPSARLISLGVGETTQPLPPVLVEAMVKQVQALGHEETYESYGSELGKPALREKIAQVLYEGRVNAEDIFVSDGSNCDIGRLQVLFGSQATIAVQDPSYPSYVSTAVLMGQTGAYDSKRQGYQGIHYLPCSAENAFFPDLSDIPERSVIFFCSPNNPTGTAATHSQLKQLVDTARAKNCLIVFDAVYAAFIRDPSLPRSIFEIEGAKEVAIESGSFSKMAGFTGVRLGWTVVPKELRFNNGSPVQKDWEQVMCAFFNAASNISQAGGLAILSPEGLEACEQLVSRYMTNTVKLKQCCESLGLSCYGGDHAPYIWVKVPGMKSWEAFDWVLNQAHVITVPGLGFGMAGEGYIRLSGFAKQADIEEASQRLTATLKQLV